MANLVHLDTILRPLGSHGRGAVGGARRDAVPARPPDGAGPSTKLVVGGEGAHVLRPPAPRKIERQTRYVGRGARSEEADVQRMVDGQHIRVPLTVEGLPDVARGVHVLPMPIGERL